MNRKWSKQRQKRTKQDVEAIIAIVDQMIEEELDSLYTLDLVRTAINKGKG